MVSASIVRFSSVSKSATRLQLHPSSKSRIAFAATDPIAGQRRQFLPFLRPQKPSPNHAAK